MVATHPRLLGVAFALADAYGDGRLAPLLAVPEALGLFRATRHLREFTIVLGEARSRRLLVQIPRTA